MEIVFSAGSSPRQYNEDPRPAESELRESLEMAIENDLEDFMCALVTVRLI
jgi:hypothetical protein